MLLGLPFWWKTTEVHRANLPFSEIDAWQERQVSKKKNQCIDLTHLMPKACDFLMPTRFTVFIPEQLADAHEIAMLTSISNEMFKYSDNFPTHISVLFWDKGNKQKKRHLCVVLNISIKRMHNFMRMLKLGIILFTSMSQIN